MYRKLFAAGVAAAFSLAFAADAQAVFITSNGKVQLKDPGSPGSPPIPGATLLDDQGKVFTNQVSGGLVGGVPTIGSEVRSIAIGIIDGVGDFMDGEFTDLSLPDGSELVFVTAVRGTVAPGPPGTVLFTEGRVFAFAKPAAGFNSNDPDTWAPIGTAFAEWNLAPQQAWLDGSPTGEAVSFAASQVNASGINAITPSNQGQGQFLFVEDSTAAQTAGATPGGGPGTGGDNFISDVVDNSPPGLVKSDEAIGVTISQTIESTSATDLPNMAGDFFSLLGATDLAILNGFGAAAFSAGADLGGGAFFATGIGGPAAPMAFFNPRFGPGVAPTGDFRAILDFEGYVGHLAVPEPTSIALFGIGALGLTGVRRRRRTSDTIA